MTKRDILWFDVDGVLVDYTRAFLKYHNLPIKYEDMSSYDLLRLFPTREDGIDALKQFSLSGEIHQLQPLVRPELLWRLASMGVDMRIITQMTAPPDVHQRRIDMLKRLFGPVFTHYMFTQYPECKLDLISELIGDRTEKHILIEDNPTLLVKSIDPIQNVHQNIKTVAILHPYNRDELIFEHPHVFRSTNEFLEFWIGRCVEERLTGAMGR